MENGMDAAAKSICTTIKRPNAFAVPSPLAAFAAFAKITMLWTMIANNAAMPIIIATTRFVILPSRGPMLVDVKPDRLALPKGAIVKIASILDPLSSPADATTPKLSHNSYI